MLLAGTGGRLPFKLHMCKKAPTATGTHPAPQPLSGVPLACRQPTAALLRMLSSWARHCCSVARSRRTSPKSSSDLHGRRGKGAECQLPQEKKVSVLPGNQGAQQMTKAQQAC